MKFKFSWQQCHRTWWFEPIDGHWLGSLEGDLFRIPDAPWKKGLDQIPQLLRLIQSFMEYKNEI